MVNWIFKWWGPHGKVVHFCSHINVRMEIRVCKNLMLLIMVGSTVYNMVLCIVENPS